MLLSFARELFGSARVCPLVLLTLCQSCVEVFHPDQTESCGMECASFDVVFRYDVVQIIDTSC